MRLEEKRIAPGAKLVYVCPGHPEGVSDKPGTCTQEKCGKKLAYKIVSDATQLAETWACPLHPEKTAPGKQKCPQCGSEMKHMEYEQVLAVPFSAVVDTGTRKVVFIDRGQGIFDAVRIEIGPRASYREAPGRPARDFYPVLKGLAVGDRVVAKGAFLLDAETQLTNTSIFYYGAAGQESNK